MGLYKNFKTVTYGVAQWADHITEPELRKQADWLQKYVGIDKIYLETFRGQFARKEQLEMIKRVLAEYNIEVSGGITTVTPNLNDSDKNRQRLFETFCYCNQPMRDLLKKVSEYTASMFDEFIIDDFFFTQCMCEDCRKEKGSRSWEEFRLAKMKEVSENLILGPAKAVNPKCKVIIKYPNWRESYQETGYNPKEQRFMFAGIYTGTETRHGAQQDQHLPRYLSYSLPRYMENALPGKNGGGWFDNFECDRLDSYLEQAYLTCFSKSREIMMFCWPSIYNDKRATPLGFQYKRIDNILSKCGNPVGLPAYIPFNSQGEDHLEDYLGMVGIPMELTPDFPTFKKEGKSATENSTVFITASAMKDPDIIEKIRDFVAAGGKVVATSGFMIEALKQADKAAEGEFTIKDITSIRYRDRKLSADEFQVTVNGLYGRNYVKSAYPIEFPLLEHRNNATWSKVNAGHGEYHESIVMFDTYGLGCFEVICLPDMPSRIRDMPVEVLCAIRNEMLGNGEAWIDAGYGVSLFTYDNGALGLYCYTNDGCAPVDFDLHVVGDKAKSLSIINDTGEPLPEWMPKELKPLYTRPADPRRNDPGESVFHVRMIPGDWKFLEIKK